MQKIRFLFNEKTDYSIIRGIDRLYFDINIWIDLAEEKTPTDKYAKELIRILVKEKKIFCPLYFPVLSELYTQNYNSMIKVGKLMNEFSLNFCFARWEEIWTSEILNFVFSYLSGTKQVMTEEKLFVPYIGYLSSSAAIICPEEYDNESTNEVTDLIRNKISQITLLDMIELSEGFKNRVRKDYSSIINNWWKNIWEETNGNKNLIRIANEDYIAQSKLLPVLNKITNIISPEQALSFNNYLNSLPKDKKNRAFNSVINNIPSLRNEIEICSTAIMDNNRKVKMNDFFDLENVSVPIAYSNVFVSRDKWLRNLFKMTNLPKINNCLYLYNMNELISSLSENYLKI